LLDAAIECLHERGFGGATLEIIAKRAGVSRGAVQFHFGNRDDLFLALLDEIKARLSKISLLDVSTAKSLEERLALVCGHYWEVLNSRHYIAAVQVQVGTLHDARLYPQVSRVLRKAEGTLDRRWVELFSDLKISADKLIMARHLALAAMRGMVVRQINPRRREAVQDERVILLVMLKTLLIS
jgi:AcrR family transcriptional regulator